jgi:hypothetical protein
MINDDRRPIIVVEDNDEDCCGLLAAYGRSPSSA